MLTAAIPKCCEIQTAIISIASRKPPEMMCHGCITSIMHTCHEDSPSFVVSTSSMTARGKLIEETVVMLIICIINYNI